MHGDPSALPSPRRARVARLLTAAALLLATCSTGLVVSAVPAAASTPAPRLTAEPASPSRSTTPTWSFDSTVGTAWECSVDAVTAPAPASWAPCGTPGPSSDVTPTLSGDGGYVFSVREAVTDPTGVDVTRSAPYVLDTVATASVGAVTSPTADSTPDWVVTPESPTSTAVCSVPGMAGPQPCRGTWTTPVALPEGMTTLTVTVTDDAATSTTRPPRSTSTSLRRSRPRPRPPDRCSPTSRPWVGRGRPATRSTPPAPWCTTATLADEPCTTTGSHATAVGRDGTYALR